MMKSTTKINKKNRDLHLIGKWFVLFCLLSASWAAKAQLVFEDGTPKFDEQNLVTLEEPATLNIHFQAPLAAQNNIKVEIDLPNGITETGVTSNSGGSIPSFTKSVTGQKITLTLNGQLPAGQLIKFQVKVKSNCRPEGVAIFKVRVLKGNDPKLNKDNLAINIVRPNLTFIIPQTVIDFNGQPTTPKDLTYTVRESSGHPASSAKISFTTAQDVTFSDFKLNNTISLTPTVTTSGANHTYTITFTSPAQMGGTKISGTNTKKITFKARGTASTCGNKTVTSQVQFPHNTACGQANDGSPVTLNMGVIGNPTITKENFLYVSSRPGGTPVALKNLNMDGNTSNIFRARFRNGSVPILKYTITIRTDQGGFLDVNQIYIQKGSGTLRKINPADITVYQTLENFGTHPRPGLPAQTPINIKFTFTEPTAANETITIWGATRNGNIFDHGTNNFYKSTTIYNFLGVRCRVAQIEGYCGNKNGGAEQHAAGFHNPIHFREVPNTLSLKGSGKTATQTLLVTPGSLEIASEFIVTPPTWLTITDIKLTKNADGTGVLPASVTVTPLPSNKGVRITSTNGINISTAYLQISYKAATCTGVNQNGTIWYKTKQYWPNGGPVEAYSQVKQAVSHICVAEGIGLDTFQVVRTDKGYTDTNNDGIPDNGTLASDNDINHLTYVSDDKGYFYWKTRIANSPKTFRYIDIPTTIPSAGTMGTTGNNLNIKLLGGNRLKINNSAPPANVTVTYTPSGNKKGLFRIYNPAGFSGGDLVELEVPFQAGSYGNITVANRLFVSESAIPNPYANNPTGAEGDERASATLEIQPTTQVVNPAHSPQASVNSIGWYMNIHSNAPTPYRELCNFIYSFGSFPNEVRYPAYPAELIVKMPAGYYLDDTLHVPRPAKVSGGGPAFIRLNSTSGSGRKTEHHFNTGELFQVLPPYNTPPTTKWRLPDDGWGHILPKATISVNPAELDPQDTVMTVSFIVRDPVTNKIIKNEKGGDRWERKYFMNYDFDVKLNTTPNSATVYRPHVTGPQISLQNNSSINLNELYFYFDGPVKDVELIPSGGGTSYTAIPGSHEGRWVKVPDVAANLYKSYNLKYTTSINDCSSANKDVTVYVGSGYGSPWSPNTSNAFDASDINHYVAHTIFHLIPSDNAKISGTITIHSFKPDTVPEGSTSPQTYTVVAELNTRNSPSMLKELAMKLSIPAGQQYVAGSAQIEYPINMFNNVPSGALETALNNAFGSPSNMDAERNTIVRINESGISALTNNFILPGNHNTPVADTVNQIIRLHMKFRAFCNTPFEGFYYKNVMYGQNICGNEANGNGETIVSRRTYPDVSFAYFFDDVKEYFQSQSSAFNEGRTEDTLVLSIKRIQGFSANMAPNDYLAVEMPKELDIVGDTIWYKGKSGTLASLDWRKPITSSSVTNNVRLLKLPFPITQYDGAGNKGVGAKIECHIPVRYTPNGQTRASNPIDSVRAIIWSELQFGNCPPKPTPFCDTTATPIGLFTAIMYPHIVYIGDTAKYQITSAGFDGKWYKEKTGGTAASNENPWSNVLTNREMAGDTIFYFSPVINGTSYGDIRLPYAVRIWLRPWFIKNLDAVKDVCTPKDTLVVKADGMDVSYQWYKDGVAIAGATNTSLVITKPGKYHVLVNDTVTPPNIISSDTMSVYFSVPPVITKDLTTPLRDCDKTSYDLEVEAQGRLLRYQWYRNGELIPGANQRKYRAMAKDSSGFYRVTIKNFCGDSISSKQRYISFCDEKFIGIARNIQLFVPNTVETTPSAKGMLYVNSQDHFVFTVKAKSGYSVKYLDVTTDSPIWTLFSGGIEKTMISDSVMQIRIRTVTQNLKVTVSGISPVANITIDSPTKKAWANNGKIYVWTDTPETIYIYTPMGILYKREKVQSGLTTFDMKNGYYFIRLSNGYSNKVLVQ